MHLNFTILDIVRDSIVKMAPRGKKVKEGVAKQMKKWERNVGLKIMLTMLYYWMWTGKGPDWHQMVGGDLEVIYCKPVIELL